MKTLTRKLSRTATTLVLVILAFIAIFRAWVFYTESPWTRDARFSADVVAIAPDVAGLITNVNVHDNQLVKKDQVLFTIDQPRYKKRSKKRKQTSPTIRCYHRKNARRPAVVTGWACRLCLVKRSTSQTMSCKPYYTSLRRRRRPATGEIRSGTYRHSRASRWLGD